MLREAFQKFFGIKPSEASKKAIKKDTAIRLICEYGDVYRGDAEAAFEALDMLGLIDHSKLEKESA
jgi:hypothetical protein